MKLEITICKDAIFNEADGSYTPVDPIPEEYEFPLPASGEFLPAWCVITAETEPTDRHKTLRYSHVTIDPDGYPVSPAAKVHFKNDHAEMGLKMFVAGPAQFPVPKAGTYEIRLCLGNVPVVRRKLIVVPRSS